MYYRRNGECQPRNPLLSCTSTTLAIQTVGSRFAPLALCASRVPPIVYTYMYFFKLRAVLPSPAALLVRFCPSRLPPLCFRHKTEISFLSPCVLVYVLLVSLFCFSPVFSGSFDLLSSLEFLDPHISHHLFFSNPSAAGSPAGRRVHVHRGQGCDRGLPVPLRVRGRAHPRRAQHPRHPR